MVRNYESFASSIQSVSFLENLYFGSNTAWMFSQSTTVKSSLELIRGDNKSDPILV